MKKETTIAQWLRETNPDPSKTYLLEAWFFGGKWYSTKEPFRSV